MFTSPVNHCFGMSFVLWLIRPRSVSIFFFNDPAPPEIYPFPLHDALPISARGLKFLGGQEVPPGGEVQLDLPAAVSRGDPPRRVFEERCHLGRGEAHEPLEPERAGERLLDAEGRGESGPDARELLQGLSA